MKRTIVFFIFANMLLSLQAVSYSGTLPVMHIQTENNDPIVSKDNYINATYYVDALGLTGYENIGTAAAPLTMEIKGRGNYTWTGFDKKPYRIKLTDKQPLLGMNKSKHFALLAHADDARDKKGFLRNAAGFELSKLIGMAWTPEAKPIEVVLNGDYIGLYFLTETIRVDKDRVNIVEQEDEETDPAKITGGWLVEIDNYDDDPHITIKEGDGHTMWFTYKTPEKLSNEQEIFLGNEMSRLDDLIYGNKNSDELWQYLDMDALARFYIVQELTDNYESFHGSCYLYREMGDGQKWKFGPVWDFGSSFNRDKSQYLFEGDVWHNHWIPEVCKFPAFMEYVKKIWNEFYPTEFSKVFTFTSEHLNLLQTAASVDAKRWSEYSGNADLTKRVNQVSERLLKNAEWFNEQWGNGDTPEIPDYPNNPNNPNYNPEDEQMAMYVWVNGEKAEYNIVDVDSITFAKKELIVVKAKVPNTWKKTIYVWVWETGQDGKEFVAKKQGDWFVYTHEGNELNIIFKNGEGWSGDENQTEDIHTTRSTCYQLNLPEKDDKVQPVVVDCD